MGPWLNRIWQRLRGHIWQFVVLGGVPGALAVLLYGHLHQTHPHVQCLIFAPVIDPDGNRLQVILIKNSGNQAAESLEAKIRTPQIGSLDYNIDSSRQLTALSRDREQIFFSLDMLPPSDSVRISIKVLGAQVEPSAIKISYRDAVLSRNEITSHTWEDLK